MKEYIVLYNRLSLAHIGPDPPPATVKGDTEKDALKRAFGYAFRRIYGEAAKSPDIVLVEGTIDEEGNFIIPKGANRRKYNAMCKARFYTEDEISRKKEALKKRFKYDPVHNRWRFTTYQDKSEGDS